MEGTLATIMMFAGNFAPRNWAYCAGQILPIAQNTALFSLLGTTYGGDGRVTFALPDLQGRVALGAGQGPGLSSYDLGQASGVQTTTMLISQMPSHGHAGGAVKIDLSTSGATTQTANGNILASPTADTYATAGTTPTVNNPGFTAEAAVQGSSQPFSIMQPYLGMSYVICQSGVFPSRP